jgi:hypothetical protein
MHAPESRGDSRCETGRMSRFAGNRHWTTCLGQKPPAARRIRLIRPDKRRAPFSWSLRSAVPLGVRLNPARTAKCD